MFFWLLTGWIFFSAIHQYFSVLCVYYPGSPKYLLHRDCIILDTPQKNRRTKSLSLSKVFESFWGEHLSHLEPVLIALIFQMVSMWVETPGANTDLLMPLVLEVWQHDVKKLMEEILHHVGCVRSVNHGINYVSTGAGFLPSAVIIGNI